MKASYLPWLLGISSLLGLLAGMKINSDLPNDLASSDSELALQIDEIIEMERTFGVYDDWRQRSDQILQEFESQIANQGPFSKGQALFVKRYDENIIYLRFYSLTEGVYSEWMKNMESYGLDKKWLFIIDLRGLSEGSTKELSLILNQFYTNQETLFTLVSRGSNEEIFESTGRSFINLTDGYVITDKRTSSMGTIFAHCLKNSAKFMTIGKPCNPSRKVSKYFYLRNGDSIRINYAIAKLGNENWEASDIGHHNFNDWELDVQLPNGLASDKQMIDAIRMSWKKDNPINFLRDQFSNE